MAGIYWSPDSDGKQFNKEYENLIKNLVSSKPNFIIVDMKINSLAYETNNILKDFFDTFLRIEYFQSLLDQQE